MATGTVKFFNETKGFGFISPTDGGDDVFVHISALHRAGVAGLNEGDQVAYEIAPDRRSGKVEVVDLQVTGSGPAPSGGRGGYPPSRGPRPDRRDFGNDRGGGDRGGGDRGGGQRVQRDMVGSGSGVVKWFNDAKGFGFIVPDAGGEDLFVHASAVERSGFSRLNEGQALSFDIEEDRRNGKRSAVNLKPND
jgi:CspA family cold shock protein